MDVEEKRKLALERALARRRAELEQETEGPSLNLTALGKSRAAADQAQSMEPALPIIGPVVETLGEFPAKLFGLPTTSGRRQELRTEAADYLSAALAGVESPDELRLLDLSKARRVMTDPMASGRADSTMSPVEMVASGVPAALGSKMMTSVARVKGVSEPVRQLYSAGGGSIGEALWQATTGSGEVDPISVVASGAFSPVADKAVRPIARAAEEKFLGPRTGTGILGAGKSAEAQAYFNDPSVRTALELDDYYGRRGGELTDEAFGASGTIDKRTIPAIQSEMDFIHRQELDEGNKITSAIARGLGSGADGANRNVAIDTRLRTKLPPFAKEFAPLLDVQNLNEAPIRIQAKAKEVLAQKEAILAEAPPAPAAPIYDALDALKETTKDMFGVSELKGDAEALMAGIREIEDDLLRGFNRTPTEKSLIIPAPKFPEIDPNIVNPRNTARTIPAAKLDEVNQLINEYERLLDRFSNSQIVGQAFGDASAVQYKLQKLDALQGGIRRSLDAALESAGMPPNSYTQLNAKYGALRALDDAVSVKLRAVQQGGVDRPSTRLISGAGVQTNQGTPFTWSPNLRQVLTSAFLSLDDKLSIPQGFIDKAVAASQMTRAPQMIAKSVAEVNKGAAAYKPPPQSIIKEADRTMSRRFLDIGARGIVNTAAELPLKAGVIGAGQQLVEQARSEMDKARQDLQAYRLAIENFAPGTTNPYPGGIPRKLDQVVPPQMKDAGEKVFLNYFLSRAGGSVQEQFLAQSLADNYRQAYRSGNKLKMSRILEDMSYAFPQLFAPGDGFDGRIFNRAKQIEYLQKLEAEGEPKHFIAKQASTFNDRMDSKILQRPTRFVTGADIRRQAAQGREQGQVIQNSDGTRDYSR